MITPETRLMIVTLAPIITFRRVQQAHRAFRLDAMRQYMIRTWVRHLIMRRFLYCRRYERVLLNRRCDGFTTIIYTNGDYSHIFQLCGNPYVGVRVHYVASGQMYERQDYLTDGGKPEVSTIMYDPISGKEIYCDRSRAPMYQ